MGEPALLRAAIPPQGAPRRRHPAGNDVRPRTSSQGPARSDESARPVRQADPSSAAGTPPETRLPGSKAQHIQINAISGCGSGARPPRALSASPLRPSAGPATGAAGLASGWRGWTLTRAPTGRAPSAPPEPIRGRRRPPPGAGAHARFPGPGGAGTSVGGPPGHLSARLRFSASHCLVLSGAAGLLESPCLHTCSARAGDRAHGNGLLFRTPLVGPETWGLRRYHPINPHNGTVMY